MTFFVFSFFQTFRMQLVFETTSFNFFVNPESAKYTNTLMKLRDIVRFRT